MERETTGENKNKEVDGSKDVQVDFQIGVDRRERRITKEPLHQPPFRARPTIPQKEREKERESKRLTKYAATSLSPSIGPSAPFASTIFPSPLPTLQYLPRLSPSLSNSLTSAAKILSVFPYALSTRVFPKVMVRALISSSGCIVIRYTLYVETGGGGRHRCKCRFGGKWDDRGSVT